MTLAVVLEIYRYLKVLSHRIVGTYMSLRQ